MPFLKNVPMANKSLTASAYLGSWPTQLKHPFILDSLNLDSAMLRLLSDVKYLFFSSIASLYDIGTNLLKAKKSSSSFLKFMCRLGQISTQLTEIELAYLNLLRLH